MLELTEPVLGSTRQYAHDCISASTGAGRSCGGDPHSPSQVIAIDPEDAENGGLIVVPGSHRLEILCPGPADSDKSFTSEGLSVPTRMSVHQTDLAAGDVLFFHGGLVHGSRPNTSKTFRRSLIFQYVPSSSSEIAAMYQPLVDPSGGAVWVTTAAGGGPCGTGFHE